MLPSPGSAIPPPDCFAERYAGCGFFNYPLERGNGSANGGTPIFTPKGVFRGAELQGVQFTVACSIKHIP